MTMEDSLISHPALETFTAHAVEDDSLAMAEELAIGPKPKRPLSAYNFFFAYERQQILESRQVRDEGKPRRSHGKCGFAQMARSVAKKWNNNEIDPEVKKMFEDKAKIEKIRYNKEMDAWKKRRTDFRRNHGGPTKKKKTKKQPVLQEQETKTPGTAAPLVSNNSYASSLQSQQQQQQQNSSAGLMMLNDMQKSTLMALNAMASTNPTASWVSSPSAPLQNAALLQQSSFASATTTPTFSAIDNSSYSRPDLQLQRLANTMDQETMDLFIDIMMNA